MLEINELGKVNFKCLNNIINDFKSLLSVI